MCLSILFQYSRWISSVVKCFSKNNFGLRIQTSNSKSHKVKISFEDFSLLHVFIFNLNFHFWLLSNFEYDILWILKYSIRISCLIIKEIHFVYNTLINWFLILKHEMLVQVQKLWLAGSWEKILEVLHFYLAWRLTCFKYLYWKFSLCDHRSVRI